MTIRNLETQLWYWGNEEKEFASRALEDCLDGTYLVRQSSTPPDQTIHVVFKGTVKLLRIHVRDGTVGLSPEHMSFNSVIEIIEYFSHGLSLTRHNNNIDLEIRLTTPLPRITRDYDGFDNMLGTVPTLAIYVRLYVESELSTKKAEVFSEQLLAAEETAQQLAYSATGQHRVVEIWREQLRLRAVAKHSFGREFLDIVESNFDIQQEKLEDAEEELQEIQEKLSAIQAKIRQLVLMRNDIAKGERTLFNKMDWYEDILAVEGIENDTISNCFAPFRQNLGAKLVLEGVKEMWFVGEMNSIAANQLLEGRCNGTFLVRLTSDHNYVISLVNKGAARHVKIFENKAKQLFWLKTTRMFHSVELLVKHFQDSSVGQEDGGYDTMLQYPVYLPSWSQQPEPLTSRNSGRVVSWVE